MSTDTLRLAERTRVVYLLRREHEMSYDEIAETLGVSSNTVKTLLTRAVRTLRQRLVPFL